MARSSWYARGPVGRSLGLSALLAALARHIPDHRHVVGRKLKRIPVGSLAADRTDADDGRVDVIGVDNIWIRVRRSDDFDAKVQPLTNIGGLAWYPQGKGGILLNQLRIEERETVPVNEHSTVITVLD